ncbi:MAG TPA: hypothetical protein VGC74_06495 [Stenotrophomonas sp.]
MHTFTVWQELQRFPASLCLYWYAVGALAIPDLPAVRVALSITTKRRGGPATLLEVLSPLVYDRVDWKFLNVRSQRRLPESEYLAGLLANDASDISRTAGAIDVLFDDLESLIALEFAHVRLQQMQELPHLHFWAPVGKFVWRQDGRGLDDFGALSHGSEHLNAGFFGGNVEAAGAAVAVVKDLIRQARLDF